jgi:hypothetical protein
MRRASARRAKSRGARLRPFVLPLMASALVAYVALHSPIRSAIARLLGVNPRAYYFFGNWLHVGRELDGLTALVLIALAVIAATFVTQELADVPFERPLVFGVSMLALVVVPAATVGGIASVIHVPLLRPPQGPLLAALPAAAFSFSRWRTGRRPRFPRIVCPRPTPLIGLVWGLAAALLVSSIALSLVHPPNQGDALTYHAPLAVFLWQDGDLTTFLHRAPSLWSLAHPGTSELWYGLLRVAGGERLADLGQLPFAALGAGAAYAFTRALRHSHSAALLVAGAFLLVPIVVIQSGMQANDVAGPALLMTAAAFAARPIGPHRSGRIVLVAVTLGLTAATKLAFLPGVVAIAGFAVGTLLHSRLRGVDSQLVVRSLGTAALAFAVVAAPWWLRNSIRYDNPIYPAEIPLLHHGIPIQTFGRIDYQFVPARAAWPIYSILEPHDDRSGFGALLAVGFLPGFLLAAVRGPRRPILLYVVLALVTIPAWWEYTLHEPRFLLPLAGLGLAFLPWSLLALPRRRRTAGVVLVAAAAIFSALVTFDQGLMPIARMPTTRAEFYDRVWGVDPTVSRLPERDSLLYNTGYGPGYSDYAAYYPLLGRSLKRFVVPLNEGDTDGTTAALVSRMRRLCLRYAYVSAVPATRRIVEQMYDPSSFELVSESLIVPGERSGARRHLYRSVDAGARDAAVAIRRYLFRLRSPGECGRAAVPR